MSQVPPLLVSVVTWWYWISSLRYWLVLGGTGSEQGSSGCQCDMLSENIWFTWCKPSNSSIFGEGKSDYGQTHTQTHRHTDRQNFLSKTRPLLWKGSSKNVWIERGWGSIPNYLHMAQSCKILPPPDPDRQLLHSLPLEQLFSPSSWFHLRRSRYIRSMRTCPQLRSQLVE